jgi:preprotein translocase subunit SecG
MTLCGHQFLDRPLGQSRDGRLQGVEWKGLSKAEDTLSKNIPVFFTLFVSQCLGLGMRHLNKKNGKNMQQNEERRRRAMQSLWAERRCL